MGSITKVPSLLLDYGVELQAIATMIAAASSGGQGNIAPALFLENSSSQAIRADENTTKSNLLGVTTAVKDSAGTELVAGYLPTNTAGYVAYASAASIVGKRFVMGEDGVSTTIKAVLAANPSWALGAVYIPLINGTDDVTRQSFIDNTLFDQRLDSSALTNTKGNLFLVVIAEAPKGNQIPVDAPTTDTSATDWIVEVNLT